MVQAFDHQPIFENWPSINDKQKLFLLLLARCPSCSLFNLFRYRSNSRLVLLFAWLPSSSCSTLLLTLSCPGLCQLHTGAPAPRNQSTMRSFIAPLSTSVRLNYNTATEVFLDNELPVEARLTALSIPSPLLLSSGASEGT